MSSNRNHPRRGPPPARAKATTPLHRHRAKPPRNQPARPVNSKGVRAPPPPSREGRGVLKSLNTSLARTSIRNYHDDSADLYLNARIGATSENVEDIKVAVNPYIVYQYIAGVVMKTMANSDRYQDYNAAILAIQYYASSLYNISSIAQVSVWPRAIVELAWSLSPRRVGQYNYAAHWGPLRSANANVATNGLVFQNVGFNMLQYANTTTGGYQDPAASQAIGVIGSDVLNDWQNLNHATLDLVNIEQGEQRDNKGDASAFAWDTGGGRAYLATGNSTFTLASMVGYNSALEQYISINSSTGLETPIRRPHLAALRLATGLAEYGSPAYHTESPNLQRTAKYTQAVISAPSTLGFQRVTKDFRSKLQIKIVPSTATVSAIASRIETLAGSLSNYSGTTWLAAWGPNDIPNFLVGLYKCFLKRYSGATIGVRSILPGGGVADAEQVEKCFGVASYNSVRLPEYVQRLMGAHTPYVDKDGILIPFVSTLSTPVTSLVYTGANNYTTPPTIAQFGTGILSQVVNRVYKTFESSMVARENLMLYGQFGKTMMDFTFLRDSAASAVLGVVSRREQTPALMSAATALLNVITYDANNITSTNQGNHSYRQHSRRLFSGYDTVSTYADINRYDGIVVGALTSNMSDATGPDNYVNERAASSVSSGGHSGVPLPRPALYEVPPKTQVGLITKWAARIIPRAGKYCGPGWTAGVDTGDTTPAVNSNGEHMVKPTDDEDAICKAHDEAYGRAGDDRKKILAADWDMVKKLRDLRREKGLSIYGLASELAIASKAGIAGLSPSSVAEYFGI